jgi:type II secretory pathway component PulC
MKTFAAAIAWSMFVLTAPASMAADSPPSKKSSQPEFVIAPYLENGELKGYSISRFRRGSVVTKLGFQEGDIIQTINGEKLETPEKAVDFYNLVRNQSTAEMKVQILRQKKRKTLVMNRASAG